jgi:hypothetical protein
VSTSLWLLPAVWLGVSLLVGFPWAMSCGTENQSSAESSANAPVCGHTLLWLLLPPATVFVGGLVGYQRRSLVVAIIAVLLPWTILLLRGA